MLRNVTLEDAPAIAEIYNHYILHTIVTFEEAPVTAEEMKTRIQASTQKLPWMVYEQEQQVVGYAYASEWKSRCAYAHSVESTVYLDRNATGKGIGSLLYTELIKVLTDKGYHTILGGIALPNPASIRLHEKLGFEQVARLREVGYKFEKWIDVGYWQLMINKKG